MKKPITPEEYAKLKSMDRLGWSPEYVGYKTKKVRDYDECDMGYSHFAGWVERTFPIGEPIRYVYHKPSWLEKANHELAIHTAERMMDNMHHLKS